MQTLRGCRVTCRRWVKGKGIMGCHYTVHVLCSLICALGRDFQSLRQAYVFVFVLPHSRAAANRWQEVGASHGCRTNHSSPVIGAAPMVPPTCWRLSVAQLWVAIHNLYYLWGLQSTLAWHGALAFYILSRHSHTTHHPYLYLLFVASHCARMGGALPEQGPCPAALTQFGVCLCLCAIICTPHRSTKL
mgnify:CR=1 FL=1